MSPLYSRIWCSECFHSRVSTICQLFIIYILTVGVDHGNDLCGMLSILNDTRYHYSSINIEAHNISSVYLRKHQMNVIPIYLTYHLYCNNCRTI